MARLGVAPRGHSDDRPLVSATIAALRTRATGVDRFFFDWRGGRVPADDIYRAQEFDELKARLEGREHALSHPYWSDPAPCSMLIDEVESIWSAIADRDDWTPFDSKIEAVRRMGEAMQGSDGA
jgi:hypothetical protein